MAFCTQMELRFVWIGRENSLAVVAIVEKCSLSQDAPRSSLQSIHIAEVHFVKIRKD